MDTLPASARVQRCPNCGNELTVVPHYVTWCDQCLWNVNPTPLPAPRTPFERLYAALSVRLSQQLFDTVRQHPALRPPLTRSMLFATASAIAVHLVTLSCLISGIFLIVRTWPNPLYIIAGLLLALIGWSGRPRVSQLRKGSREISRDRAPTLFQLVDQISATLHAQPVAHVLINENFNASYGTVGWRRAPVLTLGLPLVTALSAPELVALISHELAHGVNGDPTHGLVVGSAVQSLCQYYWLLLPPPRTIVRSDWGVNTATGMMNFTGWVTNGAMRVVALIPQAIMQGINHLLWRSSQRAEYYADRLAASIAGVAGMRGLLTKLHSETTFERVVQQAAVRGDVPDLFAATQQCLAMLPERERERIRHAELQVGGRLDSTHPPTAYRIAMLQTDDTSTATVQLAAEERVAIDNELRAFRKPLQQRLVTHYLERLSS